MIEIQCVNDRNTMCSWLLLLLSVHYRISHQMKTKIDQGREDLQWRMENILYFSGGGVLLIRNPHDAIRLG